MRRLIVLFSLILIVLFTGCVDQEISVMDGVKDGVVIKDFSFDSSSIYGGDSVGLNLEVQNVGEEPALLKNIKIFGVPTTGNPDSDDYNWGEGTGKEFDLDDNELGILKERTLDPCNPSLEFEGETIYFRWRPQAPKNIKVSTNYGFGIRVKYEYGTTYTGTIRIVREAYLNTLPMEERGNLLESSGVISASVTGGPLSVTPVKGRSFIVEEGSITRPIRFKVSNVGSGYTYTDDIGDYQVTISSDDENLKNCGVLDNEGQLQRTIKLSKGESRIFSCDFTIRSNVVNRMDVIFWIKFDYNYYVDGMTSITVEPSGE